MSAIALLGSRIGDHLDVGHPAMMVGLESHPAFKDLSGARDIPQHLLHVDVLIPVRRHIRFRNYAETTASLYL